MEVDINEQNLPAGIQKIEETPQEIVAKGKEAASLLTGIIKNQKNPVMINGKQYLQFHDWQTIARFFKTTVGVESVGPIEEGGKVVGYEAKAMVLDNNKEIISSAESACYFEEKNWENKEKFQVRSMAQTRACVKALKNVFSWVIVLAGYNPDHTATQTKVVND